MINKTKKYLFLGIVIFLILILSNSFIPSIKQTLTSSIDTNYEKNQNAIISIRDLNQNPMDYIGEKIIINGELHRLGFGYIIDDGEGYRVWIGIDKLAKDCLEEQRKYEFNSRKYKVKGIWIAPKKCENQFNFDCPGIEYKYHLECLKPLY